MGTDEKKLAAWPTVERPPLLTADQWTIVAGTLAGCHVEQRQMLDGPRVVVGRAVMVIRRMHIDYYSSQMAITHGVNFPPHLVVWTTRPTLKHWRTVWPKVEEIAQGVYINPLGLPQEGDALSLALEECIARGARKVRLLGIDETMDPLYRGVLRAFVLEGRLKGIDIEIPRADTVIRVG